MSDEAEATPSLDGGEPAAGGRLGRYVVLGRLGAGATGEVLAAYDPELDRKVALRMLRSPSRRRADERRAEQRRLAAVQALARLSDPHVVAVHDVGLHEGRVFVAMELVVGCTLTQWLGKGRRSWPQVLGVMMQAGRGLAAAHAHGLAHGSFGADDVTIGDDGRVRVMDLGLARAIDEDSGEDRCDDVEAADVVAFCSCLAEALRGLRMPGWLRRTVEPGLGDDPARRWSSMPELLAALERGGMRARRERRLVALAVIAGAGVGAWGWQRHVEATSVRACEAEGASIAEAWSTDVWSGVRDALVGTGVPRAASTAERVRPWLDAHADAWQAARTQACLRTRVHGTWSDDDHERAQWCLDERRMELEALVSELLAGDVRSIDRAVPAAWALRPVEPCLDAAALARLPTPPADQREAVQALQAELWQAAMLQQAGALDRGVAVATAALARARTRGWPPTIAAAAWRLGLLLDARGRHAEGEAMLEDAFFTAMRAGAHDVAADAASGLVDLVGVTLERPAEGLEWARHHELLLAQLPDPAGWRRTTALANVASIHRAMGAYATAEARLREVLEIREHELGPEHPGLAVVLTGLAEVVLARGAAAEAMVLAERALRLHRAGESGPEIARSARFVLARALWEAGEDRGRARTLAEGVRAELREPADAEAIAEVEQWLVTHPEAQP